MIIGHTILFATLITFVCSFNFEKDLKSSEIAILQFDSRPLSAYWQVSALWNSHYCSKHGHKYLYYSSKESCRHGNTPLADPWCKVLSMLQSTKDQTEIKAFIYLDSDAVIDKAFFNISLNSILETVRVKLNWDVNQKPVLFNQDGPCWWCNLIRTVGYTMCLNAGTVVWVRHPVSTEVLQSKFTLQCCVRCICNSYSTCCRVVALHTRFL